MARKNWIQRDWLESKSAKVRARARHVRDRGGKAADPVTHGLSPNPATNLVIADVAMRSGGELLRMAVEAALLGRSQGGRKAKKAAAGRTLKQTIIGAALGRVATRSVPGALLVGGGMLAKTLYDRAQGPRKARAAGERDIAEQADNAE